jgi:hypothetical protein
VFLILFFSFNVFMLVGLITYWSHVGPMMDPGGEAARAGAVIGSTIGTIFLLLFWALGAVILGLLALLTRGSKTIIETIE